MNAYFFDIVCPLQISGVVMAWFASIGTISDIIQTPLANGNVRTEFTLLTEIS